MNLIIKTQPTKTSSEGDWMNWYKQCKSILGRKNANSVFMKVWSVNGTSSANGSDLRKLLEDNGLLLSPSNVFGSVKDFSDSIGDFIGDVFGMGKVVFVATAVIVFGGAALIIYNIGKDPIKAMSEGAKLMKK